jgi:DNA-binding transcriptional ArsR family regulator
MRETEFRAAVLLENLGEPIRFQILRHLEDSPKTVTDLARLTKRQRATVCHHLATLRHLHLVRYRNRGRFTFYELKQKRLRQILELAIKCAEEITDLSAS